MGSSVSIQLSTRYPGTNARGQFRFSLIFSAASTAKRQSLPPTEVQVDPTGLDTSVTTTHTLTDVVAGSHGVSVMAVNENGMSQDTTATFVVKGMQCEHSSTSVWTLLCACVSTLKHHSLTRYLSSVRCISLHTSFPTSRPCWCGHCCRHWCGGGRCHSDSRHPHLVCLPFCAGLHEIQKHK